MSRRIMGVTGGGGADGHTKCWSWPSNVTCTVPFVTSGIRQEAQCHD